MDAALLKRLVIASPSVYRDLATAAGVPLRECSTDQCDCDRAMCPDQCDARSGGHPFTPVKPERDDDEEAT